MVERKSMKEPKVYFSGDGVLTINNQEYVQTITKKKRVDGIEHDDITLMQKFDRKDFNKKVGLIVDKIKDVLSKEELVKELIEKQAITDIDKLYGILKGKRKKEITKQEGCLGIKIGSGKPKTGGRYIQLID